MKLEHVLLFNFILDFHLYEPALSASYFLFHNFLRSISDVEFLTFDFWLLSSKSEVRGKK